MTRRTKLVLAVLFVTAAIGAAVYLGAPLSPPTVVMEFTGFQMRGTNQFALVRMMNQGRNLVLCTDWRGEPDWTAEIETHNGWITNSLERFTTVPMPLLYSSNRVCWVKVPPDTLRWRVAASYDYYLRRHIRYELVARFYCSGYKPSPKIEVLLNCAGELLRWLPEPKEQYGRAETPFLTNQPTVSPVGI
jgi:hypothetical protein